MKLRIKGNSLRLRISRTELVQFLSVGRIEETIHFAANPEAKLTYVLESAEHAGTPDNHVTVRYSAHEAAVILPPSIISAWSAESEVGVYANTSIGDLGTLEIAVEKDFACLDRSDEENSDTFPNPLAGISC